jgi:hypothetical protein
MEALSTVVKDIVDNTAPEDRQYFDEWLEHEGQDVNIVGSYYSQNAPKNGVIVVVYAGPVPFQGDFPEPAYTYTYTPTH